jgi:hypothetical protein
MDTDARERLITASLRAGRRGGEREARRTAASGEWEPHLKHGARSLRIASGYSRWFGELAPKGAPDMSLRSGSAPDLPAEARRPACCPAGDHLELPRPGRLALTAGWNLAESLGIPVAGYLVGAGRGGQAAGMVTATGLVWLTAALRKVMTGSVPGLLTISALVLTLQTALVVATGSTLVFLLQFPLANLALCVLFARTARRREPLVAELAAQVVGLRQPSGSHPGLNRFFRDATWLWSAIFAASAAGLGAVLAVEPASVVLVLATAVTVGGVAAGAALSALWFIRVLRRSGLHVRFAQA